MEKAKRLYRYIDECFATDVMCSIFLENYEYMNQTSFYSDLLNKFDSVSNHLLSDDMSDSELSNKITSLKERINSHAMEIIIYRLMIYYSSVIDKKYLLQKKNNLDVARLTESYKGSVSERMKITEEFTNILEENLKNNKSAVDFFLESVRLLREYEEKVYKNVMENELEEIIQ